MSETMSSRPAIEGWFTTDLDAPHLIGGRCTGCHTYVFPPRATGCPNPGCSNDELDQVPLSRFGTIWSYAENRYPPPPPYRAPDPFEPYALAAVELAEEGIIVLGKVATGVLATDLSVGMPMQLEIEPLYRDDEGVDCLVYVWAPAATERGA